MKIRESCLQTGNLAYKTGFSFTKRESWVTKGILGLLFTAGKETLAVKKEDRNTIDLKYIENNKKNKKICKNFLKNFTINIGNFF